MTSEAALIAQGSKLGFVGAVAEDDDVAGGWSGRRLAKLGPCELEQGIAMEGGGAMDLVGGGESGGEGSHEGDGLPCGVGKCERLKGRGQFAFGEFGAGHEPLHLTGGV